jgi:hypothetical protein
MDSRTPERAPSAEAAEFVRFCYRRRRVGWPELYDEMCAVAGRGLYQGWGQAELGAQGIGFGLAELPALTALVQRVLAEESDRRSRLATVVPTARPARLEPSPDGSDRESTTGPDQEAGPVFAGHPVPAPA